MKKVGITGNTIRIRAPHFMYRFGIWAFHRKLGGTLLWGPYNKDPTILGSPIFGNSHIEVGQVTGLEF